jgi:4-amino-4-deoxy-L-arabinose transferase-like glycosyltransferase
MPKGKLDFTLIAFSLLAFWYVKFSFEREKIGLRGSRFDRVEDPLLFWFGIIFVIGVGVYSLYLVFANKQD